MYPDPCAYRQHKTRGFLLNTGLLRKPLDVPLANTLDVPDDHLEGVEVKGGDGVEC